MPIVSEVMVSEVVTVDVSASIVDAAKWMIQQEKGPLPVMEGDRLHAMITDRDIIAHVVAEGLDPNSLAVHHARARHHRTGTGRGGGAPAHGAAGA
jgi:CBS domain-containing protein